VNGDRIPGGCPDCNAYRELMEVASGVAVLAVFHDDTCPMLAAIAKSK
jgi:hypothetical protein